MILSRGCWRFARRWILSLFGFIPCVPRCSCPVTALGYGEAMVNGRTRNYPPSGTPQAPFNRRLVSSAVKKRRATVPADIALRIGQLTIAERYVLRMIAQSKSTREMGEKFAISPSTVERHRYKISQKLHLSGSYGVLRFALENRRLLEEES